MEDKVKQLEQVILLMKKYRVEHVEIDGIKVSGVQPDYVEEPTQRPETDEDILFYSAEQ